MSSLRLQKYLARCGLGSRRKCESLIEEGRIFVDGKKVTTLGTKIDPEKQEVRFAGKILKYEEKKFYILLNKPKGYVTTLSDPQGRPIVTDLVKDIKARLFPVGRLDFNTEGALILTNDGDFSQKIQHPKNNVKKTYEAVVAGYPNKKNLLQLEKGIMLEDKMTAPATLSLQKKFSSSSLITITIHEGRKRQVRKMFAAIGHPVVHLKRIAYGNLYLQNLPKGSYRSLTTKDLQKIFKNIPLQKRK